MKWRWVIGTAALVAVVAAVASFQTSAQSVSPDTSMLKLFPANADAIGFVDVVSLREAPLLKDFIEQAMQKQRSNLALFQEKTGFDLERDLDRVMAGKVGQQDFLVVVRARYDRLRVEQFLVDDGHFQSENYQGWMLYRPREEGDKVSVSLIDGTVLLGSTSLVKGAIERNAAPGPSAADNATLLSDIGSIDSGNQIWGAGDFSPDMLPNELRRPSGAQQLLRSLHHGTYQMRIDSGVHARARADFQDAETVRNLTDMLQGLLALARMQVSQNPDIARLLDSVQIEMSGASMIVNVNVDGELLKKINPGVW